MIFCAKFEVSKKVSKKRWGVNYAYGQKIHPDQLISKKEKGSMLMD
jgi:gluconate kinase